MRFGLWSWLPIVAASRNGSSYCLSQLTESGHNGLTQLTTIGHELLGVSGRSLEDLGDYLACVRMAPLNVSGEAVPVQYARLVFSLDMVPHQSPLDINLGLCLPAFCSEADIIGWFESSLLPRELSALDRELSRTSSAIDRLEGFIAQLASNVTNNATLSEMAAALAQAAAAMPEGKLRDALELSAKLAAQLAAVSARTGVNIPTLALKTVLEAAVERITTEQAAVATTKRTLDEVVSLKNATTLHVVLGTQAQPTSAAGTLVSITVVLLVATALLATALHCRADHRAQQDPAKRISLLADHSAVMSHPGLGVNASLDNSVLTIEHGERQRTDREPPRKATPPDRTALGSFSLRRNWESLGSLRSSSTMNSLDGLRCVSMAWVVLGHTINYALGVGGFQFYAELFPEGLGDVLPPVLISSGLPPGGGKAMGFFFQLVFGGLFAVDSFFWLSGLLTTLSLLKPMRKMGGRWFSLYPVFVVGRWVRLTPVLAFAIAFSVGLVPSLSSGGPFWGALSGEGQVNPLGSCATNWWAAILYVQNLADPRHMCLGWSWYLANDFQFFLVAPFIIFAYAKSKTAGWVVLGTLLAGSTAANLAISFSRHFDASPVFDDNYYYDLYILPWTRAQPFLVGVGFAFLYEPLSARRDADAPALLSAPVAWCLVLSSLGVLLACLFGTYGLYQHYPTTWPIASSAVYTSLSRLGWALGLSGLFFCCFVGSAPVWNALLGWWPFQIYGKLTYSCYIVHPIVMLAYNFSKYDYVHYTDQWLLAFWTVFVVWGSLIALLVWLFIEKPAANLLAFALGRLGLGKASGE